MWHMGPTAYTAYGKYIRIKNRGVLVDVSTNTGRVFTATAQETV